MAGSSLQAASGTAESIRVVGCPTHTPWASPPGLPTSHYCFQFPEPLGHKARKDADFGLAIIGMCRGIGGQDRHSLEAARELQQSMAPSMTLNENDIVDASLLRLTGEVPGPSPTPEEEDMQRR